MTQLIVNGLTKGSGKANGIMPNDIILEIHGHTITDDTTVKQIENLFSLSKIINLKIKRNEIEIEKNIKSNKHGLKLNLDDFKQGDKEEIQEFTDQKPPRFHFISVQSKAFSCYLTYTYTGSNELNLKNFLDTPEAQHIPNLDYFYKANDLKIEHSLYEFNSNSLEIAKNRIHKHYESKGYEKLASLYEGGMRCSKCKKHKRKEALNSTNICHQCTAKSERDVFEKKVNKVSNRIYGYFVFIFVGILMGYFASVIFSKEDKKTLTYKEKSCQREVDIIHKTVNQALKDGNADTTITTGIFVTFDNLKCDPRLLKDLNY